MTRGCKDCGGGGSFCTAGTVASPMLLDEKLHTAAAVHFAYSARGRPDRQEAEAQVVAEANGALQWLEEKQKLQSSLRPTDDPVLLSSDIAKKESTLQRFAEPILNKPVPPPPKVRCQAQAMSQILAVPPTCQCSPLLKDSQEASCSGGQHV